MIEEIWSFNVYYIWYKYDYRVFDLVFVCCFFGVFVLCVFYYLIL